MVAYSLFSLTLAFAAGTANAAYSTIAADYTPSTFLSNFNHFTDTDPTSGFVEYVDETTATSKGYVNASSDSVYIGVDHTNVATTGRQSVRLESKTTFEHGLFVLDVEHMPVGCGTWPAFWMYGKGVTWPEQGEIDIIEHVNQAQFNNIALHTSDGCAVEDTWGMGSIQTTDCSSPGDDGSNTGCGVHTVNTDTFGAGFNGNKGGVWATEVASTYIRVWFFPRDSIPSDVLGNSPEPNNWGTPRASFQGSCDFGSHFGPQTITLNTDFCGTWAGAVWSKRSVAAASKAEKVWTSSTCASLASTCDDYVANNPTAFKDAYWSIRSLRIFSS